MKQITRPTLLLLSAALALSAPSQAQVEQAQVEAQEPASSAVPQRSVQLDQLMSRSDLPASLRLKSLDKSWRRVTVDASEEGGGAFMYGMRGPAFRDILSDLGVGVYYTKWQSIALGGETYLVAYRMDSNVSQQEMQDAFRQMYGGGHGEAPAPQGPRRFPPDTQLRLSLLNLRTSGSMVDIRAFDAAREIMRPRDVIEASDENLRRIGAFLPRLAQMENNGMRGLPMQNVTAARRLRELLPRAAQHLRAPPDARALPPQHQARGQAPEDDLQPVTGAGVLRGQAGHRWQARSCLPRRPRRAPGRSSVAEAEQGGSQGPEPG